MFQACKSALDIIGDCSMNLTSKAPVIEKEKTHLKKPALPPPPNAIKKGKNS